MKTNSSTRKRDRLISTSARLSPEENGLGSYSLSPEDGVHRERPLDELKRIIDEILFSEWDPIGISSWGDGCRDEYDAYVPKIV